VSTGDDEEADPVEVRYRQLQQNASRAHRPAHHCKKGKCWRRWRGEPDLCLCGCDGCVRATVLLVQAEREVRRRTSGSRAGSVA
jgi:hypothetical protein